MYTVYSNLIRVLQTDNKRKAQLLTLLYGYSGMMVEADGDHIERIWRYEDVRKEVIE